MEPWGIEPLTSWMPFTRSPSWATAPDIYTPALCNFLPVPDSQPPFHGVLNLATSLRFGPNWNELQPLLYSSVNIRKMRGENNIISSIFEFPIAGTPYISFNGTISSILIWIILSSRLHPAIHLAHFWKKCHDLQNIFSEIVENEAQNVHLFVFKR